MPLALLALAGWMALPSLSSAATNGLRFKLVELPAGGDGSSTLAVQVADFNGDGNADVALPLNNPDVVVVFYSDGAGGFSTGLSFGAGSYPHALAAGDFNEDGKVDLAVAASSGADYGVEILLNNGTGGFQSSIFFKAGEFLAGLAIGDFDRDGHQDIAATGGNSQHLTVLRGNGTGAFTKFGVFDVGVASDLVVGDFNMDGIPDLATNGGLQLLILQGDGTGAFAVVHSYPLPVNGTGLVTANLNHDNRLDVAVSENNNSSTVVFLGNGDGSFATGIEGQPADAQGIATADFDGDGNLDLALPNYSAGTVTIAFGRDNGRFRPGRSIKLPGRGAYPYDIVIGDFNADGRPDLVTANYGTGDATVMLNLPRQ